MSESGSIFALAQQATDLYGITDFQDLIPNLWKSCCFQLEIQRRIIILVMIAGMTEVDAQN